MKYILEYSYLGDGEYIEFENLDYNTDEIGKFIKQNLGLSNNLLGAYFTKSGFDYLKSNRQIA